MYYLLMFNCIIIHCIIDIEDRDEYAVQEGVSLLSTYGARPVKILKFDIKKIHPSTYISKGKIDLVLEALIEHQVDFIFWNHNIRDRNQRELEKILKKPIFDRVKIILEIFKARASSAEEKLQVEMATRKYERSKIVKAWSHLERQRGASNTVGGPGEKQIELDRRMLEEKIKTCSTKLAKLKTSREQQRKSRTGVPIVSIVGYTNVGKSTLASILTSKDLFVEDKLFATLTTNIKKSSWSPGILIADTVGFIRNFPALLSNAFASTLEEIKYSTLILHVRDIRMPCEERYSQIVIDAIQKLGAGDIPRITVWSKWDLTREEGYIDPENKEQSKIEITGDLQYKLETFIEGENMIEKIPTIKTNGLPEGVHISSHTGYGIENLKSLINKYCEKKISYQEEEIED